MRRYAARVFSLLCVVMAVAAFAARAAVALRTTDLLDWDETYYASTTATAAHGLGLYPYILGYPQIHDMGGIGYVVFLFVLAYKLLGPYLVALRAVSLVASAAAIAGIWMLTRRVHGETAGLAALALTPVLLLFRLTNTVRLDVFAIAYVAWALVLYWHTVTRSPTVKWHLLTGLVFALGLEVHLHTAAATCAVGATYLVALMAAKHDRRAAAASLGAFVAGCAAGALLFVTLNVLPNPQGFFRTAALARLSAADSGRQLNLTARMDGGRLAQTFLSPRLIARKELERYRTLGAMMPRWEVVLWLVALPAYFIRRGDGGSYRSRTLLAASVAGGGLVFNSSSPVYAAAIVPFFVPAAARCLADGLRPSSPARTEVSLASAAAIAVIAALALPPTISPAAATFGTARSAHREPEIVAAVKRRATSGCVIAGPSGDYARHFMEYPRFVGTRQVEVLIGSTYYNLQDDFPSYWREKRPDIVFGPPENGLASFLKTEGYAPVGEHVWKRPADISPGCTLSD